jgi:1-acyl-sn-glycerol-3-phosphate acyltransferase
MLIGVITLLSLLLSGLLTWIAGGFESLTWLWLLPCSFLGSFLGFVVLAFLMLWFFCAIVDQKKPQENDSKFYRTMLHLFVDAILPLARVKIKTQGLEKTPKDGRFMLVCNHIDNLDPAFLLACFRDSQLAFISKREVQNYFLVGKLMHKILCQPINRENDREALKTILKCIQILKEDKASIAVFPEGYIHKDKKLHHFRSGVFKIATKTKVPIVVCTIRDSRFVLGKLMKLQPSSVDVRLLQVIEPEEYENMTTVDLAEQIYQTMAQDLGPELVSQEEENA